MAVVACCLCDMSTDTVVQILFVVLAVLPPRLVSWRVCVRACCMQCPVQVSASGFVAWSVLVARGRGGVGVWQREGVFCAALASVGCCHYRTATGVVAVY